MYVMCLNSFLNKLRPKVSIIWGLLIDVQDSINYKRMEKEMATHSNILAWEIPRTEELGRLQSMKVVDIESESHSVMSDSLRPH